MTPSEILATLRERGASVGLGPTGTTIRIRPAGNLTDGLRRAIVANKAAVLDLLRIGDAMHRECSFNSVNGVSANETPIRDPLARGFVDADSADTRALARDGGCLSCEFPGPGSDDDVPVGTYDDVADTCGANP